MDANILHLYTAQGEVASRIIVNRVPSHKDIDAVAVSSLCFFHKRIRFRGQGVDQPHRSDDASMPLFHKHVYKLKVLHHHQLALFRIVLLQFFCEHSQCLDVDLAMSSRSVV